MTDRRAIERWLALIRLGAVVFAVLEVAFLSNGYPRGYETAAWVLTGAFALLAVALYFLAAPRV